METTDRALQVWQDARAAAMTSGVYPADFINSYLLSKCVALLEKLVEQTEKPEPLPPEPEAKPGFPGQRIPGLKYGG